jgi:nucleoside-triphosphatase THEP1
MKAGKIFILSGEINSGKTTRLANWLENRTDVGGILTPKFNSERVFQDAASGKTWPMEASENEKQLLVGRYRFSAAGFQKAQSVLESALLNPAIRFLVVDEIGPLELRNEGFAAFLRTALSFLENHQEKNLILVIRNSLVEQVKDHFQIRDSLDFDPDKPN